MRLWVDEWRAARTLIGAALPAAPAPVSVEGVEVRPWPAARDPQEDLLGDVLIEAFACRLPERALAQLRSRPVKPLWINLEYFSAEAWVDSHHGLSGPDPEGGPGARRWFFIPGIGPSSGGVIRERGLLDTRDAFLSTFARAPDAPLHALCFAYPHAPYAALLRALAAGGAAHLTLCGRHTQQAVDAAALEHFPGLSAAWPGFVAQPEFDRMLWSADCVFVRGEDSLIRALWSGKPMLWQIYPQDAQAHHAKLEAWLARYCEGWPDDLRAAYREAHAAWNGIADAALFETAWARLTADWPRWRALSRARTDAWARDPDLASRLMAFIAERVGAQRA